MCLTKMALNRDLLNKRIEEINQYYVFLKSIDDNCVLFFPHKKTHTKKKITDDIIPILKANFLLILYNLVESVVTDSIKQIYDLLASENLTYEKAINEIQILWIELNHKNFKKDLNGVSKWEQIRDTICSIANEIVKIKIDSEYFKVGWNIDKQKIEEIVKAHWISEKIRRKSWTWNRLHEVKIKRNDLAHWNFSFAEIWRNYTIQQLWEIQKDILNYIESILWNIDDYLANKKYLRP